jgi:kynureninase
MRSEESASDFAGQEAAALDAADPLARFRSRFHMPRDSDGNELLYFTGNSLGLQPKTVRGYVDQELDDWATLGVEGHVHARRPWLPYHEFLTEQMARVIGAKPLETVVMNALTVNLHLLMISFYRPREHRRKILIEAGAFPSDQYAIGSQIRCHGMDPRECLVEVGPRAGESVIRTADLLEAIEKQGNSLALVLLGGVNYYTGQAFAMREITEMGHRVGAVVGFDLAHAAGNIPLHLHDWNVDFAAWCNYKYLNGGPGAVGGAFVHERHADSFEICRLAGWWGHDKDTRFLMGPEFRPIRGAEGWQLSNPPILQMAALRASLEIFGEAGMSALRAKSEQLTGCLERLLQRVVDQRISIVTPSDPLQRGCQLSIRVKNADKGLFEAITRSGVVADWREPDVIRVAPVPLYNSFTDVFRFAEILADCMRSG